MPRAPKPQPRQTLPETTFVLDNGAYTLKAGFAPAQELLTDEAASNCVQVPNCLVRTRDRKTYVGADCNEITQWSEAVYRRPMEHGQLVNWEAQKEIWDQSFFEEKTALKNAYIEDASQTTLLLTEAPNNLLALQKNADEIVMEEWGFGGYYRALGPSLNAYNDLHPLFESENVMKVQSQSRDQPMECLLVIDSGFSHTTITPIYRGRPIHRAVRRIDLGGKHLTNLLKEIISVRHFDLHQDTKIVNDIKEDISFVSDDFKLDMEKMWKANKVQSKTSRVSNGDEMLVDDESTQQDIRVDYILPDGIHLLRGFSRPHDASAAAIRRRKLSAMTPDATEISMTLGNERFAVPEVLFSPGDIGSQQPGLTDSVMQSLSVLPPLLQATMLANTLVVGGNALIPGFVNRLQNELRVHVNTDWRVSVKKMSDPVTSTWFGGARLASKYHHTLQEYAVTREEYLEHGSAWLVRKFTYGSEAAS